MKKILASLTLFALSGILLSSCSNSSKLAITKRHYRSGYYVDFSRRRPTPAVARILPDNKHKSVQIITTKPENLVAMNTSTVVKPEVFQNTPNPSKQQASDAKTINLTATNKNISVINSNKIIDIPVLENKQTSYEGNIGGDRGAERDALSLLWIVIVVILILWLIGIIAGGFGLGGLINLLLLIALILFILWLLRIW
jgi:hypothetical protein